MSIATRVDFFLHGGYQGARDGSVIGMPVSTVYTHRFFFVADPLAGDCVRRF